jgi:thiamine-monophosphate kinase
MKISQLGEFGLIDALKKFAPVSKEVIKGIGDDAAVLPYSKSKYLLLTTDMLAEDVHFTRRMPPQGIGHKALAGNISDIAAMGGYPTFAVVSIGVPKNLSVRFIKDVYKGMQRTARAFNVSMVGGDTIRTNKMVINVALLGLVEKRNLITRDGARAGDWIFVTGPLGGSLKSGRHLNFPVRLAQARFLVENFKPSAMMDISDGLSGDLNHILKASQVGARLDVASIPRQRNASLSQALNDGEDFELLLTMGPKRARSLMEWQARQAARQVSLRGAPISGRRSNLFHFYPIGTITANAKEKINAKSFTHF